MSKKKLPLIPANDSLFRGKNDERHCVDGNVVRGQRRIARCGSHVLASALDHQP